ARYNYISDEGANQGLANLADSRLKEYDVSYNLLQGNVFPVNRSQLPVNLTRLVYSGNDFSQADLTSLWQLTCDGGEITEIPLDNTQISDSQLINLGSYATCSSIQSYDLANNQLSDFG